MTIITPLNLQILTLAQDFKPGDTTFRTIGRFTKTSIATVAKYLIGKQFVCFTPFGNGAELGYVDITAQPALVSGTTNTYEYPITTRGIDTDNVSIPPTLYSSVNEKTHRGQQTQVAIVIDSAQFMSLVDLFGTLSTTAVFSLFCFDDTTDVTVGDGRMYFSIPSSLNTCSLVRAYARVVTAGETGTTDIQIYNVTAAVDMLSTKITIDSTGTGSDTAAVPTVIDVDNDDVVTNDLIRVDIDATSTTKAKGLIVVLEFRPT